MNPTIQLINLIVRFEHEAKAQRHALTTQHDGFTNEQPGLLSKLNNHIKYIFNPPRYQPSCRCA